MNSIGNSAGLWIGFSLFILFMLSLDLGLFNRKAHAIKYREAIIWSAVWISVAMIFAGIVFWYQGTDLGLKFLTGYVIELSLSVDNLFVFLLIFSFFKVPAKVQHRVLFWGVMGALVMRLTMIFIGAALGGGAGTAGAAYTTDKEIVLPAESALSFTLTEPVTIKM